jgi:hypothetical protein
VLIGSDVSQRNGGGGHLNPGDVRRDSARAGRLFHDEESGARTSCGVEERMTIDVDSPSRNEHIPHADTAGVMLNGAEGTARFSVMGEHVHAGQEAVHIHS